LKEYELLYCDESGGSAKMVTALAELLRQVAHDGSPSRAWRNEHAKDGNIHELWAAAADAEVLVRVAGLAADPKALVLAACACARMVLPLVPEGDGRPRLAVEAAEAWARGEVSSSDARRASDAAFDARSDVEPDSSRDGTTGWRRVDRAISAARGASAATDSPTIASTIDAVAYAIDCAAHAAPAADLANVVRGCLACPTLEQLSAPSARERATRPFWATW